MLVTFCAGTTTLQTPAARSAPADLRQLWIEPTDLATRDLFHGPGGAAGAPDPSDSYELLAVDETGYSPGFDVRDRNGKQWSVKLGPEAQSEIVASRVLWAIGYHQPPTYLLTDWTLAGKQSGLQGIARFRPRTPDAHVVADWSWYENPFVPTRPFKGLVVANLILNNWDFKTSNNKVYDIDTPGGHERVYIVRDLGASLGKTSFPQALKWTPRRLGKQGSRNNLEDFEQQGFIKEVNGGRLTFDYQGIQTKLVNSLTIDDVVWACQLMSRISDAQWDAAFRAAAYEVGQRERFIKKLKAKISEGLALAGPRANFQNVQTTSSR